MSPKLLSNKHTSYNFRKCVDNDENSEDFDNARGSLLFVHETDSETCDGETFKNNLNGFGENISCCTLNEQVKETFF